LVFAWLLLVPLGPAAGTSVHWVSGAALTHGLALLVAAWGIEHWRRRRWLAALAFGATALAQVALPFGRGPLLVVASTLAAVPVLSCAGALAALAPRYRPRAVAAGAALANLPLLFLHSGAAVPFLHLAAAVTALTATVGGALAQPAPPVLSGTLSPRLVAAVGATYLVGGVTYGLALPALGGNPLGVLPYLLLLGVAAWLADRLGRGTTIRFGLAALGLGALSWGLGWSSLGPPLAALLVGCWAFVDVGWWTRLGDEQNWAGSYGRGLAAMAGAIGIGLIVTPLVGGVEPRGGAAVALAALLGAALLLPGETRPSALGEVASAGLVPTGPFEARPLSVTNEAVTLPVRLSPRERRVLELVARGASNKEIARELNVSEGTVRTHLERLYRKLGVHSRTEAAAWYWRTLARPSGESTDDRGPDTSARD
jgi:DNA-binding CsgD family transcriptional regulator